MILKILLHPIRALQKRIDAWVMARVKRQPGPVAVTRRLVYIVPTRFGYTFAFLVFLMLLASTNYSNSMAFSLTFLLTALGLVAMHHTHGNLVNIEVRAGHVPAVFAGETAHFELQIINPSRRARYSLSSAWTYTPVITHADVQAQDSATMTLGLPAQQRGWLPARMFSVETEFPLGLFHAWTWIELDMACLVYPRPAPSGGKPPAAHGAGGTHTGERAGQDEFAGLRNYQRGDTARAIHWKSLPKLQTPMVKQFHETLEQELWLDWDDLAGLDMEERLSRLTRWVLDAEGGHSAYGLRIPGTRIKPSRGEHHQHDCLKALALFA